MWQYNYTIPSNDLYHGKYKYIRKEPDGKGGYRYYYKIETNRNSGIIAEKVNGNNNSQYGSYVHNNFNGGKEVYVKKRGKSLFNKGGISTTKMEDGTKLHVEVDSLTKQAVYDTGRAVKKGAKKVKSLLKKMKKKLS